MNPTDLDQIDEINFNLDGMKICEKSANKNKCPLCPEKDEQIAMLARVNDTLFKELEKSAACEKCIKTRKLKENGNNSKSKFALDGDLNGANDNSTVGGQFNPIQLTTPKITMKKKSVHPIQTSTPKNGMEKNSVYPIQTSTPKNAIEKNSVHPIQTLTPKNGMEKNSVHPIQTLTPKNGMKKNSVHPIQTLTPKNGMEKNSVHPIQTLTPKNGMEKNSVHPIQTLTPKNGMKKNSVHPIQTLTPKNGMEKNSVHPIQTLTPKNGMEKNSVHPIQTLTPKNGMEKNSVHPIQTLTPKNGMEKNSVHPIQTLTPKNGMEKNSVHPIQTLTPKNGMEKNSVHPIQTLTPKNGMEKNSVHPIQTLTPKRTMEKNFTKIENATSNQRSTSGGFSSMFSLNSPMNFLPNWLSFSNQSDPAMPEKQNDVEESENWNLDPPMVNKNFKINFKNFYFHSPIIFEGTKNIEENKGIEKGKSTTKEVGQEKVVPSNSIFPRRSSPTIIQNEEQLPKATMEKGGGKLAMALRNGAGRKGRKLIREITETTIGSIEVDQTYKTNESETNNDGGEENEEKEEEDQNEEEDDDVNVNEEKGREVGEEEVNMAPATPNPDTYCRFCQAQFDTPRGLKIHKSGKAHGRRVAEMNGDDDQIPCTYAGCESRLSSAKSLKDHISRMHKPKFVCEECGKGYATQSWLTKHQQEKGHYA